MNYKIKVLFRKISKHSKLIGKIYRTVSKGKTKKMSVLSDEKFLKRKFKENTGKELNLDNPQTFNEKLQWLKLYDHQPIYTTMADKYAVKEYVSNIIGKVHVIPLVGGPWKNANEIEWDKLPDQFVLKCNHDCGSVIICKDKQTFDKRKAIKKLNSALKRNYFYVGREWPYKNIEPCAFAEEYLGCPNEGDLLDYKFFCFGGVPKYILVVTDRQANNMHEDLYDINFKHLPVTRAYPNAVKKITKPESLSLMIQLAEKLSKGIPHVRVDFYEVNGKPVFGEMTFYSAGGMGEFNPPSFDSIFGNWIELPLKKGEK